MPRGRRTRARKETESRYGESHPRSVRRAPFKTRRTIAGHPEIQRSRGSRAPCRTVDSQRGLPATTRPLELQVGNPGGALGALRRPKRDTGGSLPRRRALGGGCQNRARIFFTQGGTRTAPRRRGAARNARRGASRPRV
jgi:hypothetical protein